MKESIIRTLAVFVYAIIFQRTIDWLGVDSETAMTAATLIATGIVYIAIRWLEENKSPKFGLVLGVAAAPTYHVLKNPILVSAVRTLSLVIYGLIFQRTIDWLGVDSETAMTAATLIATGIVYIAIRWLEENIDPRFGHALGIAWAPHYTKAG